jgi:plastocyanin
MSATAAARACCSAYSKSVVPFQARSALGVPIRCEAPAARITAPVLAATGSKCNKAVALTFSGQRGVEFSTMLGFYRLCLRVLGVALAVVWLLVPVGLASAQDADATAIMQGVSFTPTTIHISPGQAVQWLNSSPLQHTVTSDDGSFDSGLIDPDGTFSMTFDAPGTFQYYCQPHGSAGLHGMSATIVVDDPNAGGTDEAAQ